MKPLNICSSELCSFAGELQAVIQDLDFNIKWIELFTDLEEQKH